MALTNKPEVIYLFILSALCRMFCDPASPARTLILIIRFVCSENVTMKLNRLVAMYVNITWPPLFRTD